MCVCVCVCVCVNRGHGHVCVCVCILRGSRTSLRCEFTTPGPTKPPTKPENPNPPAPTKLDMLSAGSPPLRLAPRDQTALASDQHRATTLLDALRGCDANANVEAGVAPPSPPPRSASSDHFAVAKKMALASLADHPNRNTLLPVFEQIYFNDNDWDVIDALTEDEDDCLVESDEDDCLVDCLVESDEEVAGDGSVDCEGVDDDTASTAPTTSDASTNHAARAPPPEEPAAERALADAAAYAAWKATLVWADTSPELPGRHILPKGMADWGSVPDVERRRLATTIRDNQLKLVTLGLLKSPVDTDFVLPCDERIDAFRRARARNARRVAQLRATAQTREVVRQVAAARRAARPRRAAAAAADERIAATSEVAASAREARRIAEAARRDEERVAAAEARRLAQEAKAAERAATAAERAAQRQATEEAKEAARAAREAARAAKEAARAAQEAARAAAREQRAEEDADDRRRRVVPRAAATPPAAPRYWWEEACPDAPQGGTLSLRAEELPRELRTQLREFIDILDKHSFDAEMGQREYRYVARYRGERRYQVQVSLGYSKLTRLGLVVDATVGAFFVVAAHADPRLHDQRSLYAWAHAMVAGGDATATRWLGEEGVELTSLRAPGAGGRRATTHARDALLPLPGAATAPQPSRPPPRPAAPVPAIGAEPAAAADDDALVEDDDDALFVKQFAPLEAHKVPTGGAPEEVAGEEDECDLEIILRDCA
jgi:hypothetical protein